MAGWLTWVLLCMASVVGLTQDAAAGTFSPGQTTFPATYVSQTSAPQVVTLVAQAAGITSAPTVLTEGVSNPSLAEFTVTDLGTCGANPNLSSQQACTVGVTFSPRFPGIRLGAIVLKTSGGQLLASTLISGIGQGGLPVLIPGQINTVAGDGQWFYQGDGVPATQAPIYLPSGLAVDGAGDLFLADTINNRVRRVDAVTHIISTVAGTGNAGTAGDGGPATAAEVTSPSGLALDGAGNLYIADTGNNTIRRVDAVSGYITTVAGLPGQSGRAGDGGPATSAKLNAPQGIALTPGGDLVIADTTNATIRVVTVSDGAIQTLAGTGTPGFNGDNIPASTAQLNDPSGVAVRADGAIAVADLSNNRIRIFNAGGDITTVAGNGSPGYTGDGGNAVQAELQGPAAVAFDPAGDLFVADSVNNCIRLIYGPQNTIATLAGTPTDDRYAGDGGPDNAARMHGPDGLLFDGGGNLWISDRFNNRVREVSGSVLTIGPYPTMKVGKTSQPVNEQLMNAGNQPLTLNAPLLQQAKLDTVSTTCGQASLAPAALCQMGVEFAPQSVGPNITGSVTWNSDAPNVTPIDQLNGQVLSVEPTSLAITSTANPGLLGQPVTLTATVTSEDTGRTGTVDFVEGNTTWCSGVPLAADGTASCQVPSLSLGVHGFVANYSGDNNNAASQSPVFQETIKQQAALALGVSSSPAVVTSGITLTVNASDATGTPTGTVVFYDGGTALATVTLDANGNAAWSSTNFAVGTHPISAQYSGDASNVAGTTAASTLVINQASTVTILSSGNNDAALGSSVVLTANVVSSNGPAPTGSVQFLDGASVLGSSPVAGNSASISINSFVPGAHTLSAVYSGDTNDATSVSASITQTIEQIGTFTTLGADIDPLNAGATLTLTAIVAMAPGAAPDGSLSGAVTFHDGPLTLGSSPVNATGQATLELKNLNVGSHAVVATFTGNANYAASTSTPLAEVVQQTATAIAIGSTSSGTLMGKPATFTAAVTSATGVPTGSVVFKDSASVLGSVALDLHGGASFSLTNLSPGTHSIAVTYSGDANYLPSSSAPLQQIVSLAQPTLSLSGPSNPLDAGTTAQLTATLASPGLSPTGTVALRDGATVLGTESVTTAGSFTFATAQLAVGTHTIVATYSGDTNNAAVSSLGITVTVRQASTALALTPGANPLTQGNTLTLSASLRSDSPNASGTITFFDGANPLGSAPLGATGTANLQVSKLALGTHSLTASFPGDTNHAGSDSLPVPELVVQSSSASINSSVNPSVSGQSITFTGQILGSPTPTGTVSFLDNGLLIGSAPLNSGGMASFSTTGLSVGTHTITLSYQGDSNFSSTTARISQNVVSATTQTTAVSDRNPAMFDQPVWLTATVSSNGGPATGTVFFNEGSSPLGSATLDSNGNARLLLSALHPGSHLIVAAYAGDGKASPSTSQALTLAVKQNTALAVSSSVNPAQTLTPLNLTATLANPGGAPATGSVIFADNNIVIGAGTLDSAGHATLSLPQMAAGTHAITATYAGDDANFASASASYSQTVQLRTSATTVTGTSTDTGNPQQITLIAVVKGGGFQPPSGMVNFSAGNLTLGAAPVDSTGVATITVLFEQTTQQIVAAYAGDASYASSRSDATAITAGTPAQFTVAVNTPSITLVSHQHTSVAVTVASVKGFTDTIALGCLGLPFAATCTFDNTQLKLAANGSLTATLTIDTGNPLGGGASSSASMRSTAGVFTCCIPGALLLSLLSRKARRKRIYQLSLLVLGIGLTLGATGCSGLQVSGTPPGTYTFRIIGTGQGSNTTEAQTMTLVVTQ